MSTPEWRAWRKEVYERDDYTCQLCGERGGKLEPHHILKRSLYPDLVFETLNGITLCWDCHHKEGIHKDGSLVQRVLQVKTVRKQLNEAQLCHL